MTILFQVIAGMTHFYCLLRDEENQIHQKVQVCVTFANCDGRIMGLITDMTSNCYDSGFGP